MISLLTSLGSELVVSLGGVGGGFNDDAVVNDVDRFVTREGGASNARGL